MSPLVNFRCCADSLWTRLRFESFPIESHCRQLEQCPRSIRGFIRRAVGERSDAFVQAQFAIDFWLQELDAKHTPRRSLRVYAPPFEAHRPESPGVEIDARALDRRRDPGADSLDVGNELALDRDHWHA